MPDPLTDEEMTEAEEAQGLLVLLEERDSFAGEAVPWDEVNAD